MHRSDGLILSNVESALVVLPCSYCRAIVPDRSKLGHWHIPHKVPLPKMVVIFAAYYSNNFQHKHLNP